MKLFSTEIVLGSRVSPCTISTHDFKLIRDFADLPPLVKEPVSLPDKVKYEVFASQISSPRLMEAEYAAHVNLKTGVIDLEVKQHIRPTRELYLLNPPVKGGFNRLQYHQYEDKSEDTIFLLDSSSKKSHCFKNIEISTNRKKYEFEVYSRRWYMEFESIHSYPEIDHEARDEYLYFTKEPRNSVRIWTKEIVPISSAMQAVRLMIPSLYHDHQTRWFR